MPLNDKEPTVRWFRANKSTGYEKVDFDTGVIHGVAVNTEGQALGHGVMLDEQFVKDVTRLGNLKKNGLKARFGHPNMSSEALGTFIGRYHNFRTSYKDDGTAVSRADLHLSETAKESPNGDLYSYILELAKNEPDMFGTSIVFTRSEYYHYYDDEGDKIQVKSYYDIPEDKEAYVSIAELHANDVVDQPAANPDGLFSQFSSNQLAGKVTEFLDQNPEVLDLFHKEEVRNSFLDRYESYKKQKQGHNMSEKEQKEEGVKAAFATIAKHLGFSKKETTEPIKEEEVEIISYSQEELDEAVSLALQEKTDALKAEQEEVIASLKSDHEAQLSEVVSKVEVIAKAFEDGKLSVHEAKEELKSEAKSDEVEAKLDEAEDKFSADVEKESIEANASEYDMWMSIEDTEERQKYYREHSEKIDAQYELSK